MHTKRINITAILFVLFFLVSLQVFSFTIDQNKAMNKTVSNLITKDCYIDTTSELRLFVQLEFDETLRVVSVKLIGDRNYTYINKEQILFYLKYFFSDFRIKKEDVSFPYCSAPKYSNRRLSSYNFPLRFNYIPKDSL